MSIYAKDTNVSVEKSRAEIESILTRYGASAFAYATNAGKAMIQFQADERRIMFVLDLPDRDAPIYTRYRGLEWAKKLPTDLALKKWEQACRQKWRCLALAIKAKLEAVESGISTFEEEFLAHIILPGGQTVAHHMKPAIEDAYKTGRIPPMMLEFK